MLEFHDNGQFDNLQKWDLNFLYLLFGGQKMDPERDMLNVFNFRLQCSDCMYN